MNDRIEGERSTINSLDKEEVEKKKESLLIKYRKVYNEFFGEDLLNKIVREEALDKEKKVPWIDVKGSINIFLRMMSCRKTDNSSAYLVETKYSFCTRQLQVTADLEALMEVIGMVDLKEFPELFRQSGSAREIKTLHSTLQNITFPEILSNRTELPEDKEKRRKEFLQIITYNFKEFGVETISSVYKIVIKKYNPLFPPKYISQYIRIGKLENREKKIELCKFLLFFVVAPSKREILEVICNFLYTIISKEKSPLKFKNIAVVFSPIFFIDSVSVIIGSNFKETMERLRDFLEFLLENSPAIFLL